MNIVAFEGIDACGKQTQVAMLVDHAKKKGIRTTVLSFPRYKSRTGQAILKLLSQPDAQRDPLVLQALMTVNRYECQADIEEAYLRKELVILDRYWMSGWVYGLTDGLDRKWLWDVHQCLIQPTHWFVVNISVEESFKRRPVREDAYEENFDRLSLARSLYLQAAGIFPDASVLDGELSKEEIHAAVLRRLEL